MRKIIYILVLGAILFSPACGGGGRGFIPRPTHQPEPPSSQQQLPTEPSIPSRNCLTARMPALSRLEVGSEFEFVLKGEFREEVFQGSGRILYDREFVEPVRVSRGEMIPGDAVFMAKLDADGFVPFAFTPLPGNCGLPAGRGELLKVRFRLLNAPPPSFRIRLLNTPEYLQLRSHSGGRVSFDLAMEVLSE